VQRKAKNTKLLIISCHFKIREISLPKNVPFFLMFTATGYGLDDQGFGAGGGWEFFLLHRVQTGSGTNPVSFPMRTEVSFFGSSEADM
jgi:hypothetical protein